MSTPTETELRDEIERGRQALLASAERVRRLENAICRGVKLFDGERARYQLLERHLIDLVFDFKREYDA